MTADTLWTALQIVVPFVAFGTLLLGGASSTMSRWFGRARRPLGSRRRIRPVLAEAPAHAPAKRSRAHARRAA